MLMNNHKNTNFSVSINHHPVSKQRSLKYLGVILDNKLNWKPQIEKLVTQIFTHTSKTRHVKHTQMVVTIRFTIRVFLTFSQSNATKLSPEKM